ncbi:MAG: acyl-CoA dehydrogenase family protein [Myxococcales bacterium]|nr:acyl-CoA dehydrogenase family protein [Myxococcales bacterium]
MELELTETQRLIRDTARTFARDVVAPRARDTDRLERFPVDVYRQMGELGLLGVNVPEEYGGAGAGAVSYALAMMEISHACASTSVGMAVTNMSSELICQIGTEAQKRKYVPELVNGKLVAGAFALSEPHAGSDPGAGKTTAVKRGDRWILNGTKQWITSGQYAGVLVVWARTSNDGNKGLSCFLVEKGTAGLSYSKPEDKLGLRGSNTVQVILENVELTDAHLLGKLGDGFKLAMIALDGGRIGIASQACGVARAALEASVKYSKERHAFGHAIGDFQALRFMMADMATSQQAAELLTLRAAFLKDSKRPFTREASMAKLFASEMSNKVCDKAVQIHGGYGYIDEFPVERYLRDARVQTIYEGTSEIQRVVIAREILKAAGA